MIIQIFGTKKCKDTQKALRFFKERGIQIQFIDLTEKKISRGELNSITKHVPLNELIDKNGKEFEKRNLKYMNYDLEEMLLENPLLFKTPIVRGQNKASLGFAPDEWKVFC